MTFSEIDAVGPRVGLPANYVLGFGFFLFRESSSERVEGSCNVKGLTGTV